MAVAKKTPRKYVHDERTEAKCNFEGLLGPDRFEECYGGTLRADSLLMDMFAALLRRNRMIETGQRTLRECRPRTRFGGGLRISNMACARMAEWSESIYGWVQLRLHCDGIGRSSQRHLKIDCTSQTSTILRKSPPDRQHGCC